MQCHRVMRLYERPSFRFANLPLLGAFSFATLGYGVARMFLYSLCRTCRRKGNYNATSNWSIFKLIMERIRNNNIITRIALV